MIFLIFSRIIFSWSVILINIITKNKCPVFANKKEDRLKTLSLQKQDTRPS